MKRQERWKRIGDGTQYNKLLKWRNNNPDNFYQSDIDWLESLPALGNSYYDAGVLPEVVIKPPKDNAVYKAGYMIPNKQLRNQFYNSINQNYDSRLYINRLWHLYNKSQKPTIRSVESPLNIVVPTFEKLTMGTIDRPNYSPFTNTMFISPEYAADDIEAELAHAYQTYGTDVPRSRGWINNLLSLPGDIKIGGRSGYDRPGHIEYDAHSIIEPAIHDYLTNNHEYNSKMPEKYQYSYDYDKFFHDVNNEYIYKMQPLKKK